MFELADALKLKGVLGINKRNAHYTQVYNSRRLLPLVDDKLKTKILAKNAGISVPELYCVVEIQHQIRNLKNMLAAHQDFALKPSRGSGGDGIIVVSGRIKDLYRTVNGQLYSHDELEQHITRILGGVYSLGGQPDAAVIEYRVQFDPIFEKISYLGVPDIRIIVFQGVPVMSMVRLPTRMSGGKANLHKGAIGVGIDMSTGTTLTAVWRNEVIEDHPDTGNPVAGVEIPNWRNLLKTAASFYGLTRLGYIGVDIVIDKDKGPMVLELNARPGLNIQIANRAGLLPRLKLIEESISDLSDTESKVSFALRNFKT